MADHRSAEQVMAERLEQRMEKAKAAWVSGGEREWNEDKGVVDRLYKEYLEAKRRYDAALPVIGPERADIYYWQALVDVAAASPDRSEARARFEARLKEAKAEKAAEARARPRAEEEPAAKRSRTLAELGFGSAEFEEALANGEKFTIEDHQLEWKDCLPMAKAASVLVEARPEELDAGVQWTGGAMLPFDDDQVSNRGLATRECTRAIAEEVLKDIETSKNRRTMTVITGAPGIGKTRALVYVAQQVLKGFGKRANGQPNGDEIWANVLIFSLKNKNAFLIVRRGERFHAWRCKCEAEANSVLFDRGDVHVLVDPEEAVKGGAKFAHPDGAHLILAASANEVHFANLSKDALTRDRPRFKFYAPSWTLEELEAILPKMAAHVSVDTLAQRFRLVGGAPRYLFDESQLEERLTKISGAVAKLSKEVVMTAVMTGDISAVGRHTVPGCFFSFAASDHYDKPAVSFLSSFARLAVANHYRADVLGLARIGNRPQVAGEEGFLLEELVRSDVVLGGTFTARLLGQERSARITILPCAAGAVIFEPLDVERGVTALTALFRQQQQPQQRCVLLPCKGFPAIDFADSDRCVYQVTTNARHSFQAHLVACVLEAAGILERTVRGNSVSYRVNRGAQPIKWFWAVPERTQAEWRKARAVTKGNADTALFRMVQKCVGSHVEQHLLVVPTACPRQGASSSSA